MDVDPAIDRAGLCGVAGPGEARGEPFVEVAADRGGFIIGGVVRGCAGVEAESAVPAAGDEAVEQGVRKAGDETDAGSAGVVWGLSVVFEGGVVFARGLREFTTETQKAPRKRSEFNRTGNHPLS